MTVLPWEWWLHWKGTSRVPYEKMASLEWDGVSVWRIEGEQHIRHTNVTTSSIHGFAGTKVSPYERMASPKRDKMALPERDEPRSQRSAPGFELSAMQPAQLPQEFLR